MNQSLGYLRESLARYIDGDPTGLNIYNKIEKYNFPKDNEETFIRHLSTSEIDFLNRILPDEIEYAKDERDTKRANQLNEIYELLF